MVREGKEELMAGEGFGEAGQNETKIKGHFGLLLLG